MSKMKTTVCLEMTVVLPRPHDEKRVTPQPPQYILNGYTSVHQPVKLCHPSSISKVFSLTTCLSLMLMSQPCTASNVILPSCLTSLFKNMNSSHWCFVLFQQGSHVLGRVCFNHLPSSSMMPDTDLKRSHQGSFQESTAYVGDNQLHADKGYGTRSFMLLSNHLGAHPVSHVYRWDRGQKKTVCSISHIHQNMWGANLLDSGISLHCTEIRSKKLHQCLIFHSIDVASVTCWLS